jgi:hypothetical protein
MQHIMSTISVPRNWELLSAAFYACAIAFVLGFVWLPQILYPGVPGMISPLTQWAITAFEAVVAGFKAYDLYEAFRSK